MSDIKQLKIACVVLNWNGEEDSLACIAALKKQTLNHQIIVVDNNSTDNLVSILESNHHEIVVLKNSKNKGFAGGVNTGISYALENGFDYVALINNDAQPSVSWLAELARTTDDEKVGIVTGKLLKSDGKHIDSTGDLYTSWGLPYPRGREEEDKGQYDAVSEVFSASGGASLYRVSMLKDIGLFDEDFFAYYEDVDISFRAQLAGWRIVYQPNAVAIHKIGASSGKIKDFTTYQTLKNLPWVYWKNVPLKIALPMWPRIFIAYWSIFFSALSKGKFKAAIKGALVCHFYIFKKLFIERRRIMKSKKVTDDYIKSIITYGLPPNAYKLQRVRSVFRKLRFWRKSVVEVN